MHEISRGRFDILAAYARNGPMAALMGQEIAWFESDRGRVLAALWLDTDGEFVGVILAPDLLDRYRAVQVTGFHDSAGGAVAEIRAYLGSRGVGEAARYAQGDEAGTPVDFFSPIAAEAKWHPTFRELRCGDAFSAARDVIRALMRWHDDVDGNFVEQFQTNGFDTRIWELYLFATLTEAGLDVRRPKPAPDFVARGLHGEFAIEATTINPPQTRGVAIPSARPPAGADASDYSENYLPIRYAGPLTAKLSKRYWEGPESAGMPLVFAIQDFHDTMSMSYSGSALPTYLFGFRHEAKHGDDGRLVIVPIRVREHVWGSKVVRSGFFAQPGAENVSAVMFNSQGTLPKFNRLGVQAGFGNPRVRLLHSGLVVNPDPDANKPLSFSHEVTKNSRERWIDGMDVFHNPNAVHPLDPELLPDAAHHRLLPNGLVETTAPSNKIITSTTMILTPDQGRADRAGVT